MSNDVRLGRIAGVPLAANPSVLIIAALLSFSLATGELPAGAPGHSPAAYWAAGLAGAALFFVSLLAHELAHALVARRNGVGVGGFTLWLFGGVATLTGEAPTPGVDFRIAAAGPATSLALAGVFAIAAAALSALGGAHLAVSVAGWLAGINGLLGVFNLIPGAPLDGGRVLRAALWRRHGDRYRAAVTAARAGRAVGWGLVAVGLVELLAGNAIGGLWLGFIGWFVAGAARAEEIHATLQTSLIGVHVAEVMTAAPQVAPAWWPVEVFLDRHPGGTWHRAYPVVDTDRRVVGIVTLDSLRQVPPSRRAATILGALAVPLERLHVTSPSDDARDALDALDEADGHPGTPTLVLDDGRLVGIVTVADLTQAGQAHPVDGPPAVFASHRGGSTP